MEARSPIYRLNVARLTFREEVSLLPQGVSGFFSRRFGAARLAGARYPLLLLSPPHPLTLEKASAEGAGLLLLQHDVKEWAHQLGFAEPLAYLIEQPLVAAPRAMLLMRHASGNALLRLCELGRPDAALSAAFITPLLDHTALLTSTDKRACALLPPTIRAFAHPEWMLYPGSRPGTLRLLWEEHKRHLAEEAVSAPVPLGSSGELLDFVNRLERDTFHWRDATRDLLTPLNEYEMTLLAEQSSSAIREQQRLRRGGVESALAFGSLHSAFCAVAPFQGGPEEPIAPESIAVAAPHGFSRLVHRPLRRGGWGDAALAAGALFIFLGIARPEMSHDPRLWIALAGSVLLHGLGHAWGWRRVRIGDLLAYSSVGPRERRPFLPHLEEVMPAEVKAAQEDGSWRRVVAILIGPLPGLLAGGAILTAAVFSSLPLGALLWGSALLGVNVLTLLPLPFLDGGRLLRLLFYGRFPWLEPVLRGLFAFALAVVAFWLQSLFMALLALLVAATLPAQWRMAAVGLSALRYFRKTEERVARRSGQRLPPFAPAMAYVSTVIAVTRRLRQAFPSLGAPEQFSKAAHRVCENALLRPRSWRPLIGGLVLYGGALLLPLVPTLCYLFHSRQMAELALVGAFRRPPEPLHASTRGTAVYIGMEEEAVIEGHNGTRTPFPDGGLPPAEPVPGPTAPAEVGPQRGPRFEREVGAEEEPFIRGSFSSWE